MVPEQRGVITEEQQVIRAAIRLADSVLDELEERAKDDTSDYAGANYTYEEFGFKRWLLGDGGVAGNCEECVENADAGWIPEDDEYPNSDAPPQHYNCFPSGSIISASGVSQHFKRWFAGELIVIRISGTDNLAVTPNHPILTRRGWIAARALKLHDDLLQCVDPAIFSIVEPNNHHIQTGIEDVPGSLLMSGGMKSESVPSTAEAFHGDGHIPSKIDIVRSAGTLRSNRVIAVAEATCQLGQVFVHSGLVSAHSRRATLSGKRLLGKLFEAAHSPTSRIVGGLRICRACFRRHLALSQNGSIAHTSLLETESIPSVSYRAPRYSNTLRDVQDCLSGKVRFVNPLEINVRKFSGHVFNLETHNGFFCCNSIITHNCTCEEEFKERRVRVYDEE